jgi:hypothetical protein
LWGKENGTMKGVALKLVRARSIKKYAKEEEGVGFNML